MSTIYWRETLTDREAKEIRFASLYDRDFQHGTDGHHRLLLIARLTLLLDTYYHIIYDLENPGAKWETEKSE